MKNRLITATLGLLLSYNTAFATPDNTLLECWDGTFAYNELKIEINGDRLEFISSGVDLWVFNRLIEVSEDDSWGSLTVSFSVPQSSCKTSSNDARVMTCNADLLTIKSKGRIGFGELRGEVDESMDVERTVVKIRRVSEISRWHLESSGYELTLESDKFPKNTFLTQRYFYGLGGDETGNCKVNH